MLELVTSSLSTIKEWLGRSYDILKTYFDKLTGVVSFYFSNFEYDKTSKAVMLSLILFATAIIIILFTSQTSWSEGGADRLTKSYSMDWGIGGRFGNEPTTEGPGGGATPTTTLFITTTTTVPSSQFSCMSHEDCRLVEGVEGKCCLPELTEGYSCSGYCLKFDIWHTNDEIREACKSPGACYYPTSIDERIQDLPNTCSDESYPSRYCRERYAETIEEGGRSSICCTQGPCYGYCTIKGNTQSSDCWDISKCYDESLDHTVILIEPENGVIL